MTEVRFDDEFRTSLLDLLLWRRDVRRFRPEALPERTFQRLVEIACLAPSVGLSQPWRFVSVESAARREADPRELRAVHADALAAQSGDVRPPTLA